jgi:hypothetical protein
MGTSLGTLRNIALSCVPVGHIWTTWDDDDYRSNNYLLTLYRNLIKNNATTICFTHRTQCNINTNYVWTEYVKHGFVFMLSIKKENDIDLYADKDTMEDLELKKNLLKNKHIIHTLDFNDPLIYIRMVHNSNTSLYVNKNKSSIKSAYGENFKEFAVDNLIQKQVLTFFLDYYKKGIKCMKHLENSIA